jgi:hypothetical protein
VGLTTGTTGTDINIGAGTSPVTTSGTITLNVPDASLTARGVLTTGAQSIAGLKRFDSARIDQINIGRGKFTTPPSQFQTNLAISFNRTDNAIFNPLVANTTGTQNTAIGTSAMYANTTGSENVAIGSGAIGDGTALNQNVAVGVTAMTTATAGDYNVAIGRSAMGLILSGNNNTAVGHYARVGRSALTTGNNNTAIGRYALGGHSSGDNNTVVGYQSLSAFNTVGGAIAGSNNTVVGANILDNITSLSGNVVLGDGLGNIRFRDDNTNTILPRLAGTGTRMVTAGTNGELSTQGINFWNTTGNSDVDASKFIGSTNNATVRFRTNNVERVVIDSSSGIATFNSNISAGGIAIGSKLGTAGNDFQKSLIFGNSALLNLTSGIENVCIGPSSLANLTSGSGNVAVGRGIATQFTTGNFNTFLGRGAAGFKLSGDGNVVIGHNGFTGIGFSTANENTIVGTQNFSYMSSGNRNTSIGFSNLDLCSSGSNNTIIGSAVNLNPTSYALSNNVILADGQGNVIFRNTGPSTYLNGNVGIGSFNMGSLTPTASSYLLHIIGTSGATAQYMQGNLEVQNGGSGTNVLNATTNRFSATENRIEGHLTRSTSWSQGDIINLDGDAPTVPTSQSWIPISLQTGTVTRTTGSANNSMISLRPTYNFTGTYSGQTIGIDYRPTITDINGTLHIALRATSGQVVIGAVTPAASAVVDITSTTQGFLPPRMTGAQAELIGSPAEGLMVYSTDGSGTTITSKGWWGYDGTTWVKLN